MTAGAKGPEDDLRDRYIGLLCRALTRHEMEGETVGTPIHASSAPRYLRRPVATVQRLLGHQHLGLVRFRRPDLGARAEGDDWPTAAETMVGVRRLNNLHDCLRVIFEEDVPGDILEAGVWRGGASIFMRGVVVAYGEGHRQSWVADSFEGLPSPDGSYPADVGADFHMVKELAVSLQQVQGNFSKYGLLDDNVHFLQGWFRDTLPQAPVEQLALLRLDGDMYSSTIETLSALYDRVAVGGFVVNDDYYWIDSCRQATDDFRSARAIEDKLVPIDAHGAYWRKSAS